MDIMLTLATQEARMPVGQKFGGYRWQVMEGDAGGVVVNNQLLPDPFCIVAGLFPKVHTASCVVEDTNGQAVGNAVFLKVDPATAGGGDIYLAPVGISVAITL